MEPSTLLVLYDARKEHALTVNKYIVRISWSAFSAKTFFILFTEEKFSSL